MAGLTSDVGDFTERPVANAANSSQTEVWTGDLATKTSFLVLYIIAGFVGNCVLVTTLGQCHRLKGSALNKLLICMAVINLLDCIINIPLILGSVITAKWDYGSLTCQMNSAFLQLTNIATIVALLAITFERLLAVRSPTTTTHKRLSSVKTGLLVGYIWVHSITLCIPLFIGVVSSAAFPSRYLCSITQGAPLLYVCVLSLLGYLIPFTLIVAFYIFIIYVCVKEKLNEKCQTANGPEARLALQDYCLCAEIDMSKYVGVLFTFWCILCGPYLVLSSIEQYRNSAELKSSTVSFSFEYPWKLDLIFTWLYLSYPIFLPVITLCWRKKVWQKFKNFLLCRKSNLINDALPISDLGQRSNEELSNGETLATSIPVLFATENGLHFQTYGRRSEDEGLSDSRLELCPELDSSGGSGSMVVTSRKCDVYSSQMLQLDEDTSDYDSSDEPVMTVGTLSVNIAPPSPSTPSSLPSTNFSNPSCPPSPPTSVMQLPGDCSEVRLDSCEKVKDAQDKRNDIVMHEDTSNQTEAGAPFRGDHSSNDSGRGSADDFTLNQTQISHSMKETTVEMEPTAAEPNRSGNDACIECNREAICDEAKKKKHRKKKHKSKHILPTEVVSVGSDGNTNTSEFVRPPPRLEPITTKIETLESPPSDKPPEPPRKQVELATPSQGRKSAKGKPTTVRHINSAHGRRLNTSGSSSAHAVKSVRTNGQKKRIESGKSVRRHLSSNGDSVSDVLESSGGSTVSASVKLMASSKAPPVAARRTTKTKKSGMSLSTPRSDMSLSTQRGDMQLVEIQPATSSRS